MDIFFYFDSKRNYTLPNYSNFKCLLDILELDVPVYISEDDAYLFYKKFSNIN